MIFISQAFPYLRILINSGEQAGSYAQFLGGKLELDPDDPGFADVHAEALRNPSITILVNSTTCQLCGEVFEGKVAKANFGKHMKANHPLVWDAEQALAHALSAEKLVKERAGYACDVCAPIQTFGTDEDLSEHVRLLHSQPPAMDDEGNETAGERRRPGETAIPAAHAAGG